MNIIYSIANNDNISITFRNEAGAEKEYLVENDNEAFEALDEIARIAGVGIEEIPIYASSTLDFPTEYTNNPHVLRLARNLRHDVRSQDVCFQSQPQRSHDHDKRL